MVQFSNLHTVKDSLGHTVNDGSNKILVAMCVRLYDIDVLGVFKRRFRITVLDLTTKDFTVILS